VSTYRLDKLLSPRAVAVVGASPRPASLGRAILNNLRTGGFEGSLHVVNPNYEKIDGLVCVKSVRALPAEVDVAVITTPPPSVPEIVAAAAEKGIAAAVIITAGLGHGPGSLAEAANGAARRHGLRLVGPNCLGVIAPSAKLNASFAARMPKSGDLALISQSGAIAAGMVEWATQRGLGFSAVVSVGDSVDADAGDLLDFFAVDRSTRAILLYLESVTDARRFMSAARAAARVKPVVVIKSGRHPRGAKAASTHTGALAGSDAVYDAAFRRAGLLRVFDLDELFDAVETLGRIAPFPGKRLAILTNGGGIGVLAIDRLVDLGGKAAELSEKTRKQLDARLPPTWSKANPVDIIGDADAARYAVTLEALLADKENDAVLVVNVPTVLASPHDTAGAVAEVVRRARSESPVSKPVFAVWVGEDSKLATTFESTRIPHFATASDAIRGFMHVVRYCEAREALLETPPSLPEDFAPDAETARRIVVTAIKDGRSWLDPIEAAGLLTAYAIPNAPIVTATDADAAASASRPFVSAGQSVAVKILSRDIVHKSDVGGVQLNLATETAVREAAAEILARAHAARPEARIDGVMVQPMIEWPKARELIVGIADDPTFGSVIAFGHGGTAVEVIDDKALALPPIDLKLARDLIARTRVSRLLKSYRNVAAADEHAIALTLVKLAQLAADVPELRELDINPLLADESGVIAVDARIAVAPVQAKFKGPHHPRFAVRPYPKQWERRLTLTDGTRVFIRPVRPEDEALFHQFLGQVTADDLRLRFFAPVKELSHAFIARLTQLDYARAMAFIALEEASGRMLGVVRLHADANYENGEYAILVRSDLKGHGLGWKLMQLMIDYARHEGLKRIEGQVLRENTVMLQMCRELGFGVAPSPDDLQLEIVSMTLAP
jgi:acetyltransferase